MPLVRLGMRLSIADRGAVLRSLSTAVGAIIATATMLGVLTVAGGHVVAATGGEPTSATFRLFAVLIAVVSLPVLVLLAVISRLSASIRDRRLATLRLLGLSTQQVRIVAAAETSVMSAVGTLLGAGVYVVVVHPLLGRVSVSDAKLLSDSNAADPVLWLAVLLGVPLATVAISQAPMRHLGDSPMGVANRADVVHPRLLRLAPLALGVALTGWSTTWPQTREVISATFQFSVSVVGILLTMIGLMLAVPWLVSEVAHLLARRTRRLSTLVAARRLQMEPASTTRLTAGLLIGLFVVSGAQCLVVAFETGPDYQAQQARVRADPQVLRLGADADAPGSATFAAAVDRRDLGLAFPIQTLNTPEGARGPRVEAIVASCDLLEAILPDLRECSNTAPAWIDRPVPVGKRPVTLQAFDLAQPGKEPPRLSMPVAPSQLTWDRAGRNPLEADLFVPLDYAGVDSVISSSATSEWLVLTGPGLSASGRILQLHDQMFPELDNPWKQETVRVVQDLRVIIWTVTAVVVLIGLAAFIIAAIDRAIERRRENATLQVLGTPPGLVRSAQLQQLLIPLLVGIPAAVALGLLSGASFLASGSALEATPWASVSLIGLISTAMAAAAGLLTAIGLTRPVSPELLHRE